MQDDGRFPLLGGTAHRLPLTSPTHRLLDLSLRYYSPAWRRRRNGADQGKDERKLHWHDGARNAACEFSAAAVCFLTLVSTPGAAEPELELVKSHGQRRQRHPFCPSDQRGTAYPRVKSATSSRTIKGFSWFNTSGVLEPVRRLPVQVRTVAMRLTRTTRPGAFFNFVFKDRSGSLWVGSNESLDRFDPVTETSTRFPIDGNGPPSPRAGLAHLARTGPGCCGWPPHTGLLSVGSGEAARFRHYSHDPADPDSLSSSVVRSTYEDREGTLWVCTGGESGSLRPAHRKSNGADPPERARSPRIKAARGPCGRALDHLLVRQRAGLLGSPYTAAHAVFVQGPRAARHGAQRGGGNPRRRRWQPVAGHEGQRPGQDRSRTAERGPVPPLGDRSGQHQRGHADVGVRRPRGEHLGRHGDDRTEPLSKKTAAVQALPP